MIRLTIRVMTTNVISIFPDISNSVFEISEFFRIEISLQGMRNKREKNIISIIANIPVAVCIILFAPNINILAIGEKSSPST